MVHGAGPRHSAAKDPTFKTAVRIRAPPARLRPGRDDDWDRLYGVWRAYWPDAATYERQTSRKFPVAVITVR
jgi:hypothetical protein